MIVFGNHQEEFKVYTGAFTASIFNMAFLDLLGAVLQIILTGVTIWYTVKKGNKK